MRLMRVLRLFAMIELSINFALPTLNEYTARNRVKKGRFSLGNVIKKQTENKIMLHARAQKLKLPKVKLYVIIIWLNYNRNRLKPTQLWPFS